MMKKQVLSMAIVLLLAGAAQAADAPPPIPVVAKDAKAMVGVPRPKNDTTCQGRFKKFNEQAKAGGFEVLFLGDSITHLWEQHGKAVWEKRIAPFGAANFGIGGDTTANMIWRLDHGKLEGALDPKIVVLMLGTNNIGGDRRRPGRDSRKDPHPFSQGEDPALLHFRAR